jgi:hypothetical protein
MNWDLLRKFQNYLKSKYNISVVKQWYDILINSLRYNISILEYYQFGFFKMSHQEKLSWAGTCTMYEFQLKANPPKEREILDDKRLFNQKYSKFIPNKIFPLDKLNPTVIKDLLQNKKLVFKDATGKCGSGVLIKNTGELSEDTFIQFMEKEGFDMVETFIKQHEKINSLSPSAVNTIRIFTNINEKGEVEILGCRMRISVDCEVDNMAAGNLAAPIDTNTGIINGSGVYSDITKTEESVHPITGTPIIGFEIPCWKEILHMVKEASLMYPQNKSIGWDVVLTENGPGLIEGNHDWCKLVWQLPVNKGLKELLN